VVFIGLFIIGIAGVALSMFRELCLKPSDGATLFAGLLAGAVVWWQGHLIKQQMQLQAILDLATAWDSPAMLAKRRLVWTDRNEIDKDNVEPVLEFLEGVSTLAKRRVISIDLVWDTLGWYVSRYAYYCRPAIKGIRSLWNSSREDPTLYSHLEELEKRLLKLDIRRRNKAKAKGQSDLTERDVTGDLDSTREDFARSEKGTPMKASDPQPPAVLLEMRPSHVHKGGVGVFAASPIGTGQKVADGICEEDYADLAPWSRFQGYDADVRKKIMDFCIGTPDGFIPPEDLDFNKLSIEWYMNHSCEGNVGFDEDGDFIAIRNIEPGDELTYDYGLAESNPGFAMACTCGSTSCRKTITGNDWKSRSFQAGNRKNMLPRLRLKS